MFNTRLCNLFFGVIAVFSLSPAFSAEDKPAAVELINQRCGGCHVSDGKGGWSRISEQRKTPEGWLMTLVRMTKIRGAALNGDERQQLVKHFADTQGLAPEEAQPYRYILERRENTFEQWENRNYEDMCARCHSGARPAIQRRTLGEWEKLVHFHLGQFPSLEYQTKSRDRDWFNIAFDHMVPYLAEKYAFNAPAWSEWQSTEWTTLDGRWRVVGHQPGRGDYDGWLTVSSAAKDHYRLTFDGQYTDGAPIRGDGDAVVYTGYEWRASITLNGISQQQVFTVAANGAEMSGRMFVSDQHEKGSSVRLIREQEDVGPQVMTTYPGYLKAGTQTRLSIVGINLSGKLSLGSDIQIIKEILRSNERIELEVAVSAKAKNAVHSVSFGNTASKPLLTVYRQIDAIEVEPGYGVARVGGGHTPKVLGIFEAIGISAGADGKLGTNDDLRIGVFPAEWSVQPFDEAAAHDRDVEFAGTMDAKTGIFTPAEAGPNPKRRYSTNNVGNLAVHAQVGNGEHKLKGKAQLLVTVQLWNNAPIR